MIRSFSIAMAVIALAFSADFANAGGRSSGSSKSGNQSVRIKNIGPAPVLVNAKNGAATGAAGAKTVSQNGVAQFRLRKVASQAWAADTAQTVPSTLDYSFPGSQVVYLEAAADGAVTTLTFAPPGKLF
jgi:hypothetical protein